MKPLRKIKIPHGVIVRAPGLLPMFYTSRELSDELQVNRKDIVYWIKKGLPHKRDARNHIWINGRECAAWIKNIQKSKQTKIKLEENEAYCLTCNKAVDVENPVIQDANGKLLLKGICPTCNRKVNKGISNGKSREL